MDKFMELPFVKAFLKMIGSALDYKSRTSRADFWWATLGVFILALVVSILFGWMGAIGKFIIYVVDVVLWIPQLMMAIRRLHDVGKSGWWILIALTLIGGIVLLIWFVQKGDEGDNMYGPNPESGYGY